jgi:NAD-dependent deacetylase
MDFSPAMITALQQASHVAVLTGAGISAESGIPTFREAQTGLYAQYNPQELASLEGFQKDPKLVWEWYTWRRSIINAAEPNPGHLALVAMEQRIPNFTLITQNVDGLHRRAGSQNVLELHGNLLNSRCSQENTLITGWQTGGTVPPQCPNCGAFLRPDVVWFGEKLPELTLQSATLAATSCQVFLSIGTSAIVEPAASLPFLALHHGADVIELNPQPTPLSRQVAFTLRGLAGKILPELVQAVWGTA